MGILNALEDVAGAVVGGAKDALGFGENQPDDSTSSVGAEVEVAPVSDINQE